MLVQASSLSLLPPSLSSLSLKPSSLLFDPASHSLALVLSDSSLLLFPSLSSPPLSIPPISSSASFSLLKSSNPSSTSASTLFLSASPSPSSSSVLLRAWIRRPSSAAFAPVALSFKGEIGRPSAGLDLGLRHGFGVKLAGSVNVVVVHSAAAGQIWVMGMRIVVGDGGERVDLVKCAVIECSRPIFEVRASMGLLVLGEVGGVRVFPLRAMVKGGKDGRRRKEGEVSQDHGKLITLKLGQVSGDLNSFFVMISSDIVQDAQNDARAQASVKAVSISVLSQKKFLILDSVGDLYLLILQNPVTASQATTDFSIASKSVHMQRLDVAMKVQLLAVLPDMSAKMQVVWLSDGAHAVHVMSVADMGHSVEGSDKTDDKENTVQISAIQVIFTSEKVQGIVPVSTNSVLILGQGSIFAYSIA